MSWFPQKPRHWTGPIVDAVIVLAIAAAVVGVFALLLVAFGARPARAHEWYDSVCCSGQDCFPLGEAEVAVLPGNDYLILRSQEVFAHPNNPQFQRRARWSKDGRFHRCTIAGDRNAPASICFYVPPPGS